MPHLGSFFGGDDDEVLSVPQSNRQNTADLIGNLRNEPEETIYSTVNIGRFVSKLGSQGFRRRHFCNLVDPGNKVKKYLFDIEGVFPDGVYLHETVDIDGTVAREISFSTNETRPLVIKHPNDQNVKLIIGKMSERCNSVFPSVKVGDVEYKFDPTQNNGGDKFMTVLNKYFPKEDFKVFYQGKEYTLHGNIGKMIEVETGNEYKPRETLLHQSTMPVSTQTCDTPSRGTINMDRGNNNNIEEDFGQNQAAHRDAARHLSSAVSPRSTHPTIRSAMGQAGKSITTVPLLSNTLTASQMNNSGSLSRSTQSLPLHATERADAIMMEALLNSGNASNRPPLPPRNVGNMRVF